MLSAQLLSKELSSDERTAYLLFKTEQPISFLEGQFMMIHCTKTDGTIKKKPYSIATPAFLSEGSRIGFLVKQESVEGCSEYLTQSIQEGDSVELRGPVGHFIDSKRYKNYLFVSTGSGLAPCLSLLQGLQKS